MPISTLDAITLAIALLGAVLGIINTWHAIDRKRLKIQVTPQQLTSYALSIKGIDFCITVVNRSDFPVTINEVGFLYKGTKNRSALIPMLFDDQTLPRRLEPRTDMTIYGKTTSIRRDQFIDYAFAKTACGYMKKGSSPYLKALAKELAAPVDETAKL